MILSIWLSTFCRSQTLPPPAPERAGLEAFLRGAEIVSVDKDTQLGRMNAWLITLREGDVRRRALFKYIRRNRPALMPDSYAYEMAAYELDRYLGLDLIPPTVERTIEGRSGSLQIFLEGAESEKARLRKNLQPPDPRAYRDRLDEILILEHLVSSPRSDLGDLIFQTDDWRPWRVDFSEAFPPSEELLSGQPVERCSRRIWTALSQTWDDAKVRKLMQSWLAPEEIEALLKRRGLLVAEIRRLIEDKGETAVLYRP